MVSPQMIQNCIDEIHSITKTQIMVFDPDGNQLALAGNKIDSSNIVHDFIDSPADSQVVGNDHLIKVMDEDELVFVVLCSGEDEQSYLSGRVVATELRVLSSAYRDRFDKKNFFQSVLMDNILLVDMYNRAKKLHIDTTARRVIFVVETDNDNENIVAETLKGMFGNTGKDHVTAVDENKVILIKMLKDETDEDIELCARSIVDTISAEAMVKTRVGYGNVVNELKDISKSYKEAMMAIEVGRIFNGSRNVNAYGRLGIGRLIYQLPKSLCEVFIKEVFKDTDPSTIDEEIVNTVYKFFENSLNVSETSRQLFIHRNTLVYRVEKLKALTGLDVRIFDDALTFVIAMMVYDYKRYLDQSEKE